MNQKHCQLTQNLYRMTGVSKPLVSIIVNCYNSDKYLKETLESILHQTYKNWEVVFWDNQSTDNSAEYFKGYDEPRFKYFYAPEHTPLSTARNMAASKAEGSFLAFLDCDDIWMPDKLLLQIDSAIQEDVGLVYSKFELIVNSDHISAKAQATHYHKLNKLCLPHHKRDLYPNLLHGNYIIFSSVLIKKSIFQQIGGFKDNLSQNEDYEILLKASLISMATCIDYVGVQYRIHQSNNSHLNGERNFTENVIIFSSLPEGKALKEAKARNHIKHGLFKIFSMKDYSGIKVLARPYAPKFIFEIFLKRVRYKLKKREKK